MRAVFDISAIVALLLREPHSGLAESLWRKTSYLLAWQWLQAEAEAALTCRAATPEAWARLAVVEKPWTGWSRSLAGCRTYGRLSGVWGCVLPTLGTFI